MKRFWNTTSVDLDGEVYSIRLDGRKMRLPGGPFLALKSAALAAALAVEWQAAGGSYGGDFTAEDLPLTRLAGTAQERVAPDPARSVEALAAYGASDLLCYRAERPEALAARQNLLWQPWLDWAARELGAGLNVAAGVMPVSQPVAALAALRRALATHGPFELAALGILVPATGSLVLGLAMARGVLDAGEACALTFLDEDFQAEHWGHDREAQQRRRHVAADIALACRFIDLSRSS